VVSKKRLTELQNEKGLALSASKRSADGHDHRQLQHTHKHETKRLTHLPLNYQPTLSTLVLCCLASRESRTKRLKMKLSMSLTVD